MKRLLKSANGKTLIIVDIQKDFALFFDKSYLEKVESIVNGTWDRIITIVDDINGTPEIPDFINSKSDSILYKNYGGIDKEYIQELIDAGEIEIVEENEIYRYNKQLIIPGNVHENFLVPEDMELVFTELQDVVIIGGGDEECLDDIENTLVYLGVNVSRNNSGIYSGYTRNKNKYWMEDEDIIWVQV